MIYPSLFDKHVCETHLIFLMTDIFYCMFARILLNEYLSLIPASASHI